MDGLHTWERRKGEGKYEEENKAKYRLWQKKDRQERRRNGGGSAAAQYACPIYFHAILPCLLTRPPKDEVKRYDFAFFGIHYHPFSS